MMGSIDLKRLFFCRVEWMKRYRGLSDDPLKHLAGGYASKFGYGMECWNFLASRGKLHGFVHHSGAGIVDRLATNCDEEKGQRKFENGTVVWVATRNNLATETYIVGWWTHATIYRESRPHPYRMKIERDIKRHGHEMEDEPTYRITCAETESYLVPESDRAFQIPRGSGWMGHRSLVWYADGRDKGNKEEHCRFKKAVGAYIVGVSPSGLTDFLPELDDVGYEEGRRKFIKHIAQERSHAATRRAKKEFQSRHGGRLFCQACKFDFSETYGDIGESFIEAHHVRPLSGEGSRKTTSKDFVMLCSNCHRMVHRVISRLDRPVKEEEIEQLVVPDYIDRLLPSG